MNKLLIYVVLIINALSTDIASKFFIFERFISSSIAPLVEAIARSPDFIFYDIKVVFPKPATPSIASASYMI